MDPIASVFLEFSASHLNVLLGRIEVCLDKLTDEQVWARGGGNENAIGNLGLHLCGNVRQWIVSGVGGAPDARQRDTEFDARGGVPVAELRSRLRRTVEEATSVIHALTQERLTERMLVQGYNVTVLEAVYHVVEHFSMHTGQILFVTKMLTGEDLGFYAHLRSAAGAAGAQGSGAPGAATKTG